MSSVWISSWLEISAQEESLHFDSAEVTPLESPPRNKFDQLVRVDGDRSFEDFAHETTRQRENHH